MPSCCFQEVDDEILRLRKREKWRSWTSWVHLLSGNSLPVEDRTAAQIEFSLGNKIYSGRAKVVQNKWVRWDELYEDIVIPGVDRVGDKDSDSLPADPTQVPDLFVK